MPEPHLEICKDCDNPMDNCRCEDWMAEDDASKPAAYPVAAPESDALLADPNYVHIKILRGEIALTKAQAIHIAGLPADIEERLASPVAGVSAGKLTDDQLLRFAFDAFGEDAYRDHMQRTVWKDGIDISVPSQGLRRLAAKLAQPSAEGDGWIAVTPETMPREDEWVLGWNGHWRGVAKWDVSDPDCPFEWQDETTEFITPAITHWRPLPAAPVAKEGRES